MNNKTRALSESSSLFLDALRGGAAQLVLVGHALSLAGADKRGLWANPYIQKMAVVAFFAMSGFVIAYSTLRKQASNPAYGLTEYVTDRAARLYTAFLPALLLVLVIDGLWVRFGSAPYVHGSAYNLATLVGNVFMLQDFPLQILWGLPGSETYITSFGSARPFWTVAVEWWIYLGFAWFLFRARRASVLSLAVGTALLVVPAFNFFDGRGDGLAIVWLAGALAAVAFLSGKDATVDARVIWVMALYSGAGSLGYVYLMADTAYSLPFGLGLALTMYLVVCGLQRIVRPPAQAIRAVVPFLASYSYSLYLVHYTLISALLPYVASVGGTGIQVVVLIVISNVASWAFYWCTERHYVTVRSRVRVWLAGRRRSIPVAPVAIE